MSSNLAGCAKFFGPKLATRPSSLILSNQRVSYMFAAGAAREMIWRAQGASRMADAKWALDRLTPLRGKLPRSVPQYLQSDYADFTKKVDALIAALKSVGSGDQIQKDQTTYNNKKKELDELKRKVNNAIGDQQSKISDIRNSISDINKSGTKLNGILKDKKEKAEQDLMKNISSFASNAQMIIVAIEPPAPIADD